MASFSALFGKPSPRFHVERGAICDEFGRERMFRGVNLAGAKVPASPDGDTRFADSLIQTSQGLTGARKNVSFVGRPFPEERADEHLTRLASIGCNLVRWNITWEAVEHEAPGVYDEEYLAYLRRVILLCEKRGIFVFIDPHQDVWSRWTGGDGAPAWTLEKCGFDVTKLYRTGAAFTHQDEGAAYKDMTWQLNYGRYACATMFTLFWAGDIFAPRFLIDGMSANEFLQSRFISAMTHAARRIKDCKAVIGFGIINEPHPGYIGIKDLSKIDEPNAAKGFAVAPFEGMKAAAGLGGKMRRFAAGWRGFKLFETVEIPPAENGAFLNGFSCPWKDAGVWDIDGAGNAVLLRKNHFATDSWAQGFYKSFQKRFIAAMEQKHESYLFFTEGAAPPDGGRSSWNETDAERAKIVDTFHWYDAFPLLFKKWIPFFTIESDTRKIALGTKNARASFLAQIKRLADAIRGEGLPALLGEFGIPFDMNKGASYNTGDYSGQTEALSAYYDALDELLLSCALWNYTPYNTHAGGDGWNKEDLSVYCDDDTSLRAQKAYCRPYPAAVAGKLLRMKFLRDGAEKTPPVFEAEWESREPPARAADAARGESEESFTTEIFVPSIWFPDGWKAEVLPAGDGCRVIPEPHNQRLRVITSGNRRRLVRITSADGGTFSRHKTIAN